MEQLTIDQTIDKLQNLANNNECEMEVLITESDDFSTSFHQQKLNSFEFSKTKSFGVRIIKDGKEGSASSENFSVEAITETFKDALDNSKYIEKNYTPAFISNIDHKNLEKIFNPKLDQIDVKEKVEKAKALEKMTLEKDERISAVPYNGYTDSKKSMTIFNTNGVKKSYTKNYCFMYAYPLAKEGEETGMSGDSIYKKDFNSLDIETLSSNSVKKSVAQLTATTPKTGSYPILFHSDSIASLLGRLISHFSAKSVSDNQSKLKDKLNEEIFSKKITFTDNPLIEEGPGARPFDAEGTPSKITPLVENGVLKTYLTNSVYAQKLNLENTANASRSPESSLGISSSNFIVQPGNKTTDELLKSHPQIIHITSLDGMAGYDGTSGDFSIQSTGEIYEEGKYKGAIKNFVVSGNIFEVLKNIEDVGNNSKWHTSGINCPSILTSALSIAGK